jgi:DNA invertase Pin-like site-specific DNA recombinase
MTSFSFRLRARVSRFWVCWIRKTMRRVTRLVMVLITSCHASLYRSVGEIITTVDTLVKRYIWLLAVKEGIRLNEVQDLQTRVMVTLFGLFAEIERERLSLGTKEVLAAARAAGKRLGRLRGTQGRSKLDGREQAI